MDDRNAVLNKVTHELMSIDIATLQHTYNLAWKRYETVADKDHAMVLIRVLERAIFVRGYRIYRIEHTYYLTISQGITNADS